MQEAKMLKIRKSSKEDWTLLPLLLVLGSGFIIAILDFPLYTINNSINLPHWFLIGSTQGDIIIFTRLTGIPLWIMIIIAIMQLILGLLFFYFRIIKKRNKSLNEQQVK